MTSRRLDISSLLCSDDDPPKSHVPVPEPVVLAPHLRNPNAPTARAANQHPHRPVLFFPVDHDVPGRRHSPSPPVPPRRFQNDYQPPPLHSPATYAPPSPASPYNLSLHDPHTSPAAHRASSSPTAFFQSPLLPSPYHHRPSTSSTSYQQQQQHYHQYQNIPRTQSNPHSRSTSNPTPVSAHPFSGSSPASVSTSVSSPLSSARSPRAQKGNLPFVGLDALVHVASQESRRLSTSLSASPGEKHSSVSPIVSSPLHRSGGGPPFPTPALPHWPYLHQEDKLQNAIHVSEEPTHRASASPAFPPHLISRYHGTPYHGTPDDDLSSADHRRHLHIQHVPHQSPLSDLPTIGDSGQHGFSGHSFHSHHPSRVAHERSLVNLPTSPVFEDVSRRTPPFLHQPHRGVRDHSFLPQRPHEWPEIGKRVAMHTDQDANRGQIASRVGLSANDRERGSGRDVSARPVASLNPPSPPYHRQSQPGPLTLPQHVQEVDSVIPQFPVNRDLIPPKGQRRGRVKSPMDVSDDRPKKRQRSFKPAEEVERTTRYEEHFCVSDATSRKPVSPTIPIVHIETESRNNPVHRVPKDEYFPPASNSPIRSHGGTRFKSSIADLLNAEAPAQELKHAQPEMAKPVEQMKPIEASGDNRTSHESGREEEIDRQDVAMKKRENQEQDAHEWLLEHYGASPPNSSVATLSVERAHRVSPPTRAPSLQSKTAEAHGTFEQVLEEVAGMAIPHTNNNADTNVDIVKDLVVETLEGVDCHPMDVEDELLSLVGERPVVLHPSRHLPSAPSPLSQQHPAPTHRPSSPGSDNLGVDKPHSQRESPAVQADSVPSPSTHSSTVVEVLSSEAPLFPTPTLDRGSMPPPVTTTVGKSGPSKKGESASGKKKEKTSKSVPKAKATPKPRAKPVPKAKSKPSPDSAASSSTGKAAKHATLPVTAVPSAVKKSISADASRSRSTSVMPRGSIGPEGDHKGDVDEMVADEDDDHVEDDKLYCVCKTKYDEDRAMIACDRCDEWYHTQCVNMPDLEIDLVDQFICPPCIEKHPDLSLKTTYKTRCFLGLKHADPSSSGACHKPARGVFSKYCSDECGIKYMQSRIDAWTQKGGNREKLWESVKSAEKREGIVVCAGVTDELDNGAVRRVKMEVDTETDVKSTVTANAKTKKTKGEREIEMLNAELDRIVRQREQIKKEMEVALWRRRLLEIASARAEHVDQCGWDQRLCFGDEEWTEFGAGVWNSYETDGAKEEGEDAMNVDVAPEDEGAWWCSGKKVCERHAGWQTLRGKDVSHEIQIRDESLQKLTSQEREIRKRIEDFTDQNVNTDDPSRGIMESLKGMKANGEQTKKVKKKAQ